MQTLFCFLKSRSEKYEHLPSLTSQRLFQLLDTDTERYIYIDQDIRIRV